MMNSAKWTRGEGSAVAGRGAKHRHAPAAGCAAACAAACAAGCATGCAAGCAAGCEVGCGVKFGTEDDRQTSQNFKR